MNQKFLKSLLVLPLIFLAVACSSNNGMGPSGFAAEVPPTFSSPTPTPPPQGENPPATTPPTATEDPAAKWEKAHAAFASQYHLNPAAVQKAWEQNMVDDQGNPLDPATMTHDLTNVGKFYKFVSQSMGNAFDFVIGVSSIYNNISHDLLASIIKDPKSEDLTKLKDNILNSQITTNRWMKDRILAAAMIYGVKIKDSESVDFGTLETPFKETTFQFGHPVLDAIGNSIESKDKTSSKTSMELESLVVLQGLMNLLQSDTLVTESGVYVSFLDFLDSPQHYDAFDTRALRFMKSSGFVAIAHLNPTIPQVTNSEDTNLQQSQTLAPQNDKDHKINKIDALWANIAKERNLEYETVRNVLCSFSPQGC